MIGQHLFKGHCVRYYQNGQGKPMIFLHNGGNDHRIWDYQTDYFQNKYNVFAMDLLGFGQSDKPDIEYTLQLYTDLLEDFINNLTDEPVILVGQCIGSSMALNYSLQNPHRVHKLILCNTATLKTVTNGEFGFIYRLSKNQVFKYFFPMFMNLIKIPRYKIESELQRQYGKIGESKQEFIEHIVYLYRQPNHLRVLWSLLKNIDDFAALDKFQKPSNFPKTCLVWGAMNKILFPSDGKEFSRILKPDFNYFVERCGHLLMREKPDEFNTIIETILDQNSKSANEIL